MVVKDRGERLLGREKVIKSLCGHLMESVQKALIMDKESNSAEELMNCATVIAGNLIGGISDDRKHASQIILHFCDHVSNIVMQMFDDREKGDLDEG